LADHGARDRVREGEQPPGRAIRRERGVERLPRTGVRARPAARLPRRRTTQLRRGSMSRRVAGAAGTAIALGLLAACGSGEPVHLSATEVTLTTTSASNPTVAIAPRTGTVYVAWVGTTEGESNVHLARVEDGITM